ncbi:protein FAM210B, mitochondrial [Lacerta agilis]|uniref:protein FAM210B, mitochondrial n=1 Tax=Lacerta agilis TaxID=80427 RepID=UPI001419459A|nr:protein FAM210B, mitochondrial [Lacerta agilis]
MLRLGRPCALHALCPGGLLHVSSRSAASGEAVTGSLPAGAGLPIGQVQPSPGVEKRAPRRTRWRGSRRLLREALLLLLQQPPSPGRFWFPAAGADPRHGREGDPQKGRRAAPASCSPRSPCIRSGEVAAASGPGRWETSETAGNDRADPSQENGKKPNKSQQLKKVFKEYGAVGVGFHVGISLMSLGMFYLAVSSGVDMTAILFKLGFDDTLVQSKLAAGTSTFVLAYAIHKLFAPVRISITLVSVPLLVRYFRKIGFFKPPAPNP